MENTQYSTSGKMRSHLLKRLHDKETFFYLFCYYVIMQPVGYNNKTNQKVLKDFEKFYLVWLRLKKLSGHD